MGFFYPVGILLLIGLIYLILYLTGVFDGDKIILSPKPLPPIVKVGSGLVAVPAVIRVPAAASASTIGPAAASASTIGPAAAAGSSSTLATPAKIPNTNEMINIVDQPIPLPAPAIIKKTTFGDYRFETCDIPGYDLSCRSRDGLSDQAIADSCSSMKDCNSFIVKGDGICYKNIPDNAVCNYNPDIRFYGLKSKNIVYKALDAVVDKITSAIAPAAVPVVVPKTYLQEYNTGKCDIGGFDLTCGPTGGRSHEEIANICYNTKDCNSFNIFGNDMCLKNVPDNSSCQSMGGVDFYGLKSKNIKYNTSAPVVPKTYLQDYDNANCDIGGLDLSCGKVNGRTTEEIANICSNTKDCNAFNTFGDGFCLKNIPNNAGCQSNLGVNFYSLKSKNIRYTI